MKRWVYPLVSPSEEQTVRKAGTLSYTYVHVYTVQPRSTSRMISYYLIFYRKLEEASSQGVTVQILSTNAPYAFQKNNLATCKVLYKYYF